MGKKLLIVESPTKSKTIGKFLGRNYKVVASMGHVIDLPKSRLGVNIEDGFVPKYITIRGKGDIVKKLKTEAKKSEKIYLATDPDREGEAISWHIANVLDIDKNEPCRIEFNEITKNAVKDAIKNPRKIDQNLVDAQQARRILDRIVGYKISPLLWRKVKKGLSAGRVQSVAIRIICDREEEIGRFKPEEYWTLAAILYDNDIKAEFETEFYGNKKGKIKLNTKEDVDRIKKEIENGVFEVIYKSKKEKKRYPTPPFTTSRLQQEASNKLGFSTKKTMLIAQQLYEGIDIKGEGTVGLVTYIRTDSVRVSNEARKQAKEYILEQYGSKYYPDKPNMYKSKKGTQDAHEAIRPTSAFRAPDDIKNSLTKDQYKLYKLIFNKFISSQMEYAIYDTVTIKISCNDYIFKATGSTLKFPGFLTVYTDGEEKDENILPDINKGDDLSLLKLNDKQHFTKPPARYTEASLVQTLEEKGIGRPSTYSPIINTILTRGYVEREERYLKPTELGTIVNDIMKEYFKDIVDVQFTANMEQDLDFIEEGQKNWNEVLEEFYQPFSDSLKNAEEQMEKIEIKEEVSKEKCEKCGKNLVVKQGRYGKFLACPGFPECRFTKPLVQELNVKCPKCGSNVVVKKTKKGRRFYGCKNYPDCDFVSWNEPVEKKCPECGGMMVKNKSRKSKGKLKCTNDDCGYTEKL
ncbi:MAG: type I DNA topoisomerase [Clostridia bacterium]|nr:type I DNA topoisomerase [Clostridia bacterium]